jgi:hypothetical protein
MTESSIKSINDPALFEQIFYKYFLKASVALKTSSGDIRIEFFGYAEGNVALKIPFVKNMPDTCIIFARHDINTIYCSLKFIEKQEETVYIFKPLRFQIITAVRKEERKEVETAGEGKSILYITNVISDFIIQNSLSLQAKKVEQIRETVKTSLEKRYKSVKIILYNGGMKDPRMKYFYEQNPPLQIVDILKKELNKKEDIYNFYLNEIYTKDHLLNTRKNLVSEMSVPILYKGKIPYGYIQVNDEAIMDDNASTGVKRMGIAIEELFTRNHIFPTSEEKLLVADVSKSGIGIVFKERRYIRYFKENSYVFYDLVLPGNKKASTLGIIRNIGILENKVIKIGCQIKEMDALSETNYDEFLESMGLSTV